MSAQQASAGAPQVYGGDEINAMVLDPGSNSVQYGYAGNDSPSLILPSSYAITGDNKRIFDDVAIYSTQDPAWQVKPLIERGQVVDWDAVTEQWTYMTEKMNVKTDEQPLLVTENILNSFDNKKRAMEVAFETLDHCAYYAVKQPSAVSFAHGRANCLVVDVGKDLITVTPIIDGFSLKNQVMGTTYAGAYLDQELTQICQLRGFDEKSIWQKKFQKGIEWEGKDSFKADFIEVDPKVNKSVLDFKFKRTLNEMKESIVECCLEDQLNPLESDLINPSLEALDDEETRFFELPNGVSIPFTLRERQMLGNSLFDTTNSIAGVVKGWEEPQLGDIRSQMVKEGDLTSKEYVPLRRKKVEETPDPASKPQETALGLTQLVHNVLSQLDVDVKPQLANNIILTGSTSMIPRLNEKLTQELIVLNPSMKIRIHCAGNSIERKYGAWIGGSILASLGTFHQLWVSKQEWQEMGPERLVVNRFR